MVDKTWLSALILVAACDRNPKSGVDGTGPAQRPVTPVPVEGTTSAAASDPMQVPPGGGPGDGGVPDAGVPDAAVPDAGTRDGGMAPGGGARDGGMGGVGSGNGR